MLNHSLALLVAVPLFAAFFTPLVHRMGEKLRNLWVLFSFGLSGFLVLVLAKNVIGGSIQVYTLGAKFPSLTTPAGFPIRIILEADGIAVFMALISVFVALLVSIFSLRFIEKYKNLRERTLSSSLCSEDKNTDKYYALLLIVTAGMLGLIFSGDMFTMFVFLELLSISSCGLIAFYGRGKSSEAAFKYLVISAVAGLMILFATGLLYSQYGLLNIAALSAALKFTFLDIVALGFLVAGFAIKCGAVPLHMWVSDAYGEAPAPISAILIIASQASLYALFRISFTLFGSFPLIEIIAWSIIIFGVLSMFIGVTMAILQTDIKRLIAYHSVSQTGYMLLGVGVGLAVIGSTSALSSFGIKAMEGGIFHILNYSLYGALLFLAAGALIYRTGTKDLNKMGGLAQAMPLTAIFFLLGSFAIAGLPPLNGFASKLLIYESVFRFSPLLSIIAMLVSILTLASFIKVFYLAFLGPKSAGFQKIRTMPRSARQNLDSSPYLELKEVPRSMILAMGVISLFVILFGLFPNIVVDKLVGPAAQSLIEQFQYINAIL